MENYILIQRMENCEVRIIRKICNVKWKKKKIQLRKNLCQNQFRTHHIHLHFEGQEKSNQFQAKDQISDKIKNVKVDNWMTVQSNDEGLQTLKPNENASHQKRGLEENFEVQIEGEQLIAAISKSLIQKFTQFDSTKETNSPLIQKQQEGQLMSCCWQANAPQNDTQIYSLAQQELEQHSANITISRDLIEEQNKIQERIDENSVRDSVSGPSQTGIDAEVNIKIGYVRSIHSSQDNQSLHHSLEQEKSKAEVSEPVTIDSRGWRKTIERIILISHKKMNVRLKICLYQFLSEDRWHDATIQIWRLGQSDCRPPTTTMSLKEFFYSDQRGKKKPSMEVVGRIKVKKLGSQDMKLLKSNLQILVGSCLKMNGKSKITVEANPSKEQVLQLIG